MKLIIVYTLLMSFVLSTSVLAQQTGRVYTATEAMDGEGAEVLRLFPGTSFKHADPFILLDDFNVSPPAGFPAHQHKGFEAITYMIAGGFVHKDNIGNNDTIIAGQAQRFTAGKGLVHSEMPGTTNANKGLQLWLNIPTAVKQTQATYQLIDILPIQSTQDSTRIVRTIAGKGSSLTVNCGCDLSYLDVQLKSDSIIFSPIAGYTSFVYVIEGFIQIKNAGMIAGQFYFLESGITYTIIGGTNARFVYLSAKPLNQPIKQRGPYVY
ncbi:pirin family protein [Cytophaga aurantiaca]|uniref:pirin family protein n=1 Tax=Cytophaga aurantiaca TaxID=29530 RepID=UPI00037F8548|nr:pirin family protein [Cytophaga aurantiaca]